ncbi:MAG TPA: hypothetical protein VFV87_18220 [Pirellulaceae bacterium]|nr:hypothetical protein [Pirellulaceae bacterium]
MLMHLESAGPTTIGFRLIVVAGGMWATGFGAAEYGWISWLMTPIAIGVFGSGLCDLAASFRSLEGQK